VQTGTPSTVIRNRLRLPSNGFEVERVEGISERNPGIVTWKQGLYWISVVPPYRKGKQDIVYSRTPPQGAKRIRGGPRDTLHTRKGNPPARLVVDVGAFDADIQHGTVMDFIKEKPVMRNRKRRRGRLLP